MTITYAGPLPLTLAVGASLIIAATNPPVAGSFVTLTYDGTAASLTFDPAALGNPATAFAILPTPATPSTPLFPGIVTDARAARTAMQALDAAIVQALGVSDATAAKIAGALVDDSLKAGS